MTHNAAACARAAHALGFVDRFRNFRLSIMLRRFVVAAALLSCLVPAGQAQSLSTANATPRDGGRPLTTKPAKTSGPAEGGTCNLGVIPIVGNRFNIEKRGFFRFDSKYQHVGVDWGLDDLAVARVRAATPGDGVRRIPYTIEDLKRSKASDGLFDSLDTKTRNFVRDITKGINCKRYVLIHRRGDPFVFGIGIFHFGPTAIHGPYLFALTHIRVYDGQTFELIRQGPALTADETFAARLARPIQGPYREVDGAAFPTTPGDVNSSSVLRDGTRALLASSLDRTLPALLAP
jgi:hypothetical protein